MVIGWLLCSLALVATSFAASPMHILLFHGLMYNLGQLLLYVPSIAILSEWFTTRRGLALGRLFFFGPGFCENSQKRQALLLGTYLVYRLQHYTHIYTQRL